MDPNANNPGAASSETDLSQTRYFPPPDGYRAQEMPEQATQPVQPVQPEQPEQPVQPVQPLQSPMPAPHPAPQAPYPQQPYPQQAPYQQQSYAQPNPYPQQPYPTYAETPVHQPMMSQPVPPYSRSAGRNDRVRSVLALLLIGGGILFMLGQFNHFLGFGELVLLLLGSVLLYAYWSTHSGHRIGFLIPGAILFGLGLGQVLSNWMYVGNWEGDFTTLGLGFGFCLIWLLERRQWWALIPGGILVLVGLSSIALLGSFWPVALIALGVYLLYGQSRRRPVR